MPRNLIVAIAAVVLVVIAGVAAYRIYFSGPPALTETVTVKEYVGGVTSSAPQDYAAQTEGIFAKYNLKVEFVVLAGTSQAVQAVAADRSGLAFVQGDILDQMLIADQNPDAPPLVAIAATQPLNPVALVFLEKSGISKPTDLIGKKIGVPTGSLSEQYLNVFLQKQGIDKTKVTVLNVGFAALHPALLQGQVDVVCEFARGIGSLQLAAPQEKVKSFLFGDYQMPTPLGAVVVQKSLLDTKPSVAKAIAQASTEALYFCATNPEKCVHDFVDQNQGRDYEQTLAEWKIALKAQNALDPESAKKLKPLQLGWFDPALVSKTLPELRTVFAIKREFDPTSLYTNQFVERP